MKWRNIALIAGALMLVAAFAVWWLSRTAPVLTVATWAGPYGRAQASAMFTPYSAQAWVDVRIAQYDGGLDELRGQVGAHRYDWDAIDLELPDAIAACKEGLLEPMDPAGFPKSDDDILAANDFVKDALGPCWVGSVVYSQMIGFAPDRVKDTPKVIADFFDLRRYPGPRGLRRSSAKLNLELALLASGVKPQEIYATLSTHDGVTRALAKLDTIRPFIVWWSKSGDPLKMLTDEKVVFTTMPNSALFDAAAKKQKIGAIWDYQLYEMDVFGIPRGDPKKPMAMEFLHFATSTKALAKVAEWVPYGPARKSSIGLVGKNPELGIEMRPYLPTAPEHFHQAFR
ncbi:MAG TPA: extracellular solute-binding protein, partial [Rhizomicrobium sp.]